MIHVVDRGAIEGERGIGDRRLDHRPPEHLPLPRRDRIKVPVVPGVEEIEVGSLKLPTVPLPLFVQDKRIKRYLRHPFLIDLPPHPLAHSRDHPLCHHMAELALGREPGVAVDHDIDIGGLVLKAAEERARTPERARREREVREESLNPDVPRRYVPDLLLGFVDPDHIAAGNPVDTVQVFGFVLPDPGEGLGEFVFPVPPARGIHPFAAQIGDVPEYAPDPVGVIVV